MSKIRYLFQAASGDMYYIYRGDAVLNLENHAAHKWYFISADLIDVNHFTNECDTPEDAIAKCKLFDESFQKVWKECLVLREHYKKKLNILNIN